MNLITESGVSATTGQPFVNIRVEGDSSGQLTPTEARELALTILGAAEAAITDAALMTWLEEKFGMTLAQRAQIMADYRVARRELDPESG